MAREREILMLGPSTDFPGGMTEVVRAYGAAGLFALWPLHYVPTYAGRGFGERFGPWLVALGTLFLHAAGQRVALVHVHSAAYGSFWRKSVLCALAHAFGVPYVIHLHDGRWEDFYRRGCGGLARRWVRTVLRKAARVVVLTEHWRGVVQEIEPAARTAIVGNPVPVPAAVAPLKRPARTVVFLGWLHADKGVLDLVQAMPAVLRAVPAAKFVLAGSGDAAAITRLAASLGVEHALRLPGWVGGMAKLELLTEADVFVLPSYYEGLPLGVLEAMACGVAVVATPVGGVGDVIRHDVNGLLVEPGQPGALARALISLLEDDALRERLRDAARSEVRRRYALEAVVAQLGALYRSLGMAVK